MSQDVIISVEGVSKKFATNFRRSILYGVQDITRDLLGLSNRSDHLRKDEFWALQDVSFELKQGDTLGIVGPNGAGKSTLLKMLNGIIKPDKGCIRIHGRVGGLIEIGAGFHSMLTGRENIYVNGAILGMSKAEIKRKFDSIVEFAEIGDFLDVPVKYYSSGMYVRLGFAVAAHCQPDVLLVDEVLSVGDIGFQKKCFRFFEEDVLNNNVTLVLVSHSVYTVSRMCAKTIVFHKGEVRYLGDSWKAVPEYLRLMRDLAKKNNLAVDAGANIRAGAGEVRMQSVRMLGPDGTELSRVRTGEKVEFELVLRAERDFERIPGLYLQILDMSNTVITYSSMPLEDCMRYTLKAGDHLVRCIFSPLNLMPGTYTLVFKIGGAGSEVLQDNLINAAAIEVVADKNVYDTSLGVGLVYTPCAWTID